MNDESQRSDVRACLALPDRQAGDRRAQRDGLLFAAAMIVLSLVWALASVGKGKTARFQAEVEAGSYGSPADRAECSPVFGDGQMQEPRPEQVREVNF
jgi:hypothetical protein